MMGGGSPAELILSRKVWSFNHETDAELHGCGKTQGEEPPCEIDQSDWIDAYTVGSTVDAGAPGVGRHVWRVTAVNADGLWGVKMSNTIHVPNYVNR